MQYKVNTNSQFLMHLTFEPQWGDIAVLRKTLIALLSGKITNPDDAYRVGLVVSELLENAYKYKITGAVDLQISYNVKTAIIVVLLSNITNQAQLSIFREIYDEVYAASPMTSYKKMMLRSTDGVMYKRQLGLARVRYEGRAKIAYSIEENSDISLPTKKQQPDLSDPLYLLKLHIQTRVARPSSGRE